jgi:hypothetical protein
MVIASFASDGTVAPFAPFFPRVSLTILAGW